MLTSFKKNFLSSLSKSKTLLGLICLSLVFIYWAIPLFQYGLFGDGIFYGNIARNLIFDSQNSIWELKVSNTLDSRFSGHPPFAFWCESLFFYLFGEHFWIERFYSLFCAFITIILLQRIWILFYLEYSFIPVFIWLCYPIISWTYTNNMIECTLTIFTTLAVYVLLKVQIQKSNHLLGFTLAILLIFCALWTKGLVGLFPLATPFIYGWIFDKPSVLSYLKQSILLFIALLVCFILFIAVNDSALNFLKSYYTVQISPSIMGTDSIAAHRLYLMQVILLDSLIAIGIILLLKFITYRLKLAAEPINWDNAILFISIGLSASLPIIISPKQLNFYSVPSIVFFALGLSCILFPILKSLRSNYNFPTLNKFLIAIFLLLNLSLVLFSIHNYGKNYRDKEILNDVRIIGQIVPSHSEIYLEPSLYKFWNLHGYFYRYFYIDLNTEYKNQEFAVVPKNNKDIQLKDKYLKIENELIVYDLYKLKK